jgi:peptide/nickel transport system permease protein
MVELSHTPTLAVAVLVLLSFVLVALTAPWIAPQDPAAIDVTSRLIPPVWAEGGDPAYLLGTDSLGRDILSRLIYGSRVSALVAVTVVAISGTIGLSLGLFAGYFGGWYDDTIMRAGDILLAFPFLLLAISILAVLGPGLVNVIIVLALWGWVPYARVVRATTLSLREKEFVEAALAIGMRGYGVVFRHILPNTLPSVIVIATLAVSQTILAEAALSFLGLGVNPAVPTWGGMLAEGRTHITRAWWIVTFPGLAITITILSINFFGDWLRDKLDPRLRI